MYKWLFVLLIFFSGCHKRGFDERLKGGETLVKEITSELSTLHSKEDCLRKKVALKKKLRKLTLLMIKGAEEERKNGSMASSAMPRIYSDQLYYQMLRVAEEIEGGREFLEEIQQEMLDKLDVDQRKSKSRRS